MYTTQKATSNECSFFTLPFVDGYLWSDKRGLLAGLRFKTLINGKEELMKGGDPVISSPDQGKLHISWPLVDYKGTVVLDIDEKRIKISMKGDNLPTWFFRV